MTITMPFKLVEDDEVFYSKRLSGTAEAVVTQYLVLRLREINGSDTIQKILFKDNTLNLSGTRELAFECWNPLRMLNLTTIL
jgi:hypothetical protein